MGNQQRLRRAHQVLRLLGAAALLGLTLIILGVGLLNSTNPVLRITGMLSAALGTTLTLTGLMNGAWVKRTYC